MKNLKKALVLVLAFAMVFGIFTINASAASFNDDADIVNKEAVEAMAQLGVINGYEDGTFLPKQVVTRAEMCKMIAVALNGGTAPILDTSAAVFSDTKGHWASDYINYCASKGIVSGDAGKGGPFRPDATITGIEAAKMMLVALGYNSTYAGFTGADWASNVALAANDKGLFDGLGLANASVGLSRDNAAQLIYNGINAKMVKYDNVLGVDPVTGQLQSTPTVSDEAYSILTNKFKVQKVIGVLVANETFGLSGTASKDHSRVFVRSIDGTDLSVPAAREYKVKAPAELIGQEVSLYIKTVGSTTTVIGNVYATANNKVVRTTSGLSKSSETTPGSYLKYVKDNSIKFETTAAAGTEYKADATGFYVNNVLSSAFEDNGNGVELVFIDNDNDGKYEIVTKTTSTLTRVIAVNTTDKNLTLSTAGVVDFKNCIGYENLAKNDYVNYTLKNGTYTLSKAETVTGKVTAYTDGKSFTVGGVVYKPSASALQTTLTAVTTTAGSISALGFTDTYTFYLDLFGNPVAYKVAEAGAESSNYAAVLSSGVAKTTDALTGSATYTGTVKLLLADGTVSTYTIDMLASAKKFAGEKNTWGSYTAAGVYQVATGGGTDLAGGVGGLTVCDTTDTDNPLKILSFAKYIANSGNVDALTAQTVYNELAGQIVTYTIGDDGKIILAPTADKRDGSSKVYKNLTTLGGGVMNSSTTFMYYDSVSKKGTSVTGIANLASTSAAGSSDTVATYLIDSKTNLVKYVFINAAPKSSSSYAYVKSDVSVISEGGKTYNSYDIITTAGDKITVKVDTSDTVIDNNPLSGAGNVTAANTMTKDAIYEYKIDSNNVVTSAEIRAHVGSNTLSAAGNLFTGYVSAINGEVVTLTGTNGTDKLSFVVDGVNVWNVTGSTPVASEITENNVVTIVTAGSPVKVAAAYITKVTAPTYKVSFNGTVIGYYPQGASVTINTSAASSALLIDKLTAGSDDTTATSGKYPFYMPGADIDIREAYTLTLSGGATATVGGSSASTLVGAGATVVVTASAANKAITFTGVTATTVTAPSASEKGVYSFTMPAADVTATQAS